MKIQYCLCFLAAFIVQSLAAEINGCVPKHDFLPCGYDTKIRPNANSGPTEIKMQLFIESFGKIDIEKMEVEAFGYLAQYWRDDRLAKINGTPIILEGDQLKTLWAPDIYCVNCRSHNLENGLNFKQSMMRIDKNGSIYLSAGVNMVASCYMDLRKFPFDVQDCDLVFSSYGYNTSYVTYSWKKQPFVKSTRMDQFMVKRAQGNVTREEYMSGTFDIITASFSFVRMVGFYILQLYVPTAMLVFLSWTMFCLNQDHTGDRITIGVTLFLTMIFLHGYANTSLPKVSYVKVVDLFMVFSLTEILVITIESIVICKLFEWETEKEEREAKQEEERANDGGKEVVSAGDRGRGEGCFRLRRSRSYRENEVDHTELHQLTGDHVAIENGNDGSFRALEVGQSAGSADGRKENNIKIEVKWKKKKRSLCRWHVIIETASMIIIPTAYFVFNAWYWLMSLYFEPQEKQLQS